MIDLQLLMLLWKCWILSNFCWFCSSFFFITLRSPCLLICIFLIRSFLKLFSKSHLNCGKFVTDNTFSVSWHSGRHLYSFSKNAVSWSLGSNYSGGTRPCNSKIRVTLKRDVKIRDDWSVFSTLVICSSCHHVLLCKFGLVYV